MGGVVKSVTKAIKQVADFGVELVRGVANVVVALSRVDKLVMHPDEYLKNLGVEAFKMFAEPIAVFTGREFAYELVYWAAIAAALVAAWYIGPEIAAAVDQIAMLAIESMAAYVTSAAMATVVYYTMSAAAMVGSAYLTAFLTSAALYGISESYFTALYGTEQMFKLIGLKRFMEADFSSSLMDGSIYDWMAGGVALNAVMAGGVIANPSAPNDPYTKAFMYESKSNDIMGGVSMAMPYNNLAGGDMFGLNGSGSSPYNPLVINV